MTNRRQLLQMGLAVSAASVLTAPLMPVAGTARGAGLRLRHYVFDNRFAEAIAMARSMAGGAPLAETNGDMTDLWFNHLYAQWKRAPEALGGTTTPQGLFVLETLAADHRMRVIHRREYATADGHPLVSWIIVPRATA